MPLSAGTKLGTYEIVAPLGAGGMGEVYRARDTRLNREVAIKVMSPALAADADYLARFQREAQVLASLNHPNIAAIYGIETDAIVMELVEGSTLADQIERGALPWEQAIPLAKQIAEAVEAAHEKGIIHRDLKPANVKVTPDGMVKILDFGLAKELATANAAGAALTDSPTLTIRATQAGVIMGTAAYMSPEQAAGKPVDKRSDIWSFGVLLMEMLTGRRLFAGETISHTLAHVLTAPIPLEQLPPSTPPAIRTLIGRCLDRTLKNRLRDIGEARVALSNPVLVDAPETALKPRATVWAWLVPIVVLLLAGGVGWWRAARPPELRPMVRLNAEIAPDLAIESRAIGGFLAISPDGGRISLPMRGADRIVRLYTLSLQDSQPVPLAGTESATMPFFSPDGQWIGFAADGRLKKVPVLGGAVVPICDAAFLRGASWGDDGNIVFAPRTTGPLFRVSSAGGRAQPLTTMLGDERTHRWPQVLPGSQVVLFTAHTSNALYDDARVEAFSVKTGQRKTVHTGGFSGRYLRTPNGSGQLVYIYRSTLFAAPFDPDRLVLSAAPAAVLPRVSATGSGGGEFAISENGTVVYLPGTAESSGRTIAWIDQSGKRLPLQPATGLYYSPRLSPDGKRLAFSIGGTDIDLWVKDLDRDTPLRLSFFKNTNEDPVWTPDGKAIVFRSTDATAPGVYWIRSDGGGAPVRLTDGKKEETPYSISPDGKRLAFSALGQNGVLEIYTAPFDGDRSHPALGKPELFVGAPFAESRPAFSPDGRWLAYDSIETGHLEVYVRPFPGPGGRWQISDGGGSSPIWSHDGRELLYLGPDRRIMAAGYTAKGESFVPGKPRLRLDFQVLPSGGNVTWDLAPDDKRFVVLAGLMDEDQKPQTHLTFLFHFGDELQRRTWGAK